MNILIPGGLGYIGSAVVHYLRNLRHRITIVDKRFIPERVARLPANARFVEGDICDTTFLRRLARDADVMFFLAAEVEAEKSIDKERVVWDNNFEAPKRLFESLSRGTRIVFPSTGNVFGGVSPDGKWRDLTEEDPPSPRFPYAMTKHATSSSGPTASWTSRARLSASAAPRSRSGASPRKSRSTPTTCRAERSPAGASGTAGRSNETSV